MNNNLKIATWNVNSIKVRLPQVLNWLKDTNCDILALQELKVEDTATYLEEFNKLGYNCIFNSQKTYNGVAIISKHDFSDVTYDIPNYLIDKQKRVISALIQGIRIICVYVVNGESLESSKFIYKLEWLRELTLYLDQVLATHSPVIVLGDFNIAPDAIDVHNQDALGEQILCSTPEKEAWHRILNLGLQDAYRILYPNTKTFTWWDYRNFSFRRNRGYRIDHVLISNSLTPRLKDCYIDIEARKHERPSDHAPVIMELE